MAVPIGRSPCRRPPALAVAGRRVTEVGSGIQPRWIALSFLIRTGPGTRRRRTPAPSASADVGGWSHGPPDPGAAPRGLSHAPAGARPRGGVAMSAGQRRARRRHPLRRRTVRAPARTRRHRRVSRRSRRCLRARAGRRRGLGLPPCDRPDRGEVGPVSTRFGGSPRRSRLANVAQRFATARLIEDPSEVRYKRGGIPGEQHLATTCQT
jgi:hypothetical protein